MPRTRGIRHHLSGRKVLPENHLPVECKDLNINSSLCFGQSSYMMIEICMSLKTVDIQQSKYYQFFLLPMDFAERLPVDFKSKMLFDSNQSSYIIRSVCKM